MKITIELVFNGKKPSLYVQYNDYDIITRPNGKKELHYAIWCHNKYVYTDIVDLLEKLLAILGGL